ncbi:MAG: carboxypeptidase regulatory-like domain-containing protein [Planctomycetes bacterium]|nr:carboxypeptidase regulatory-like domain-containing protein [Planctomycetota bacterium]
MRVRVRVVDGDGAPIAGARVERKDGTWSPTTRTAETGDPERAHAERWDLERPADGDRAAWTDANGIATFPRVAPGQHAFHVERHAPILDGEWTSRDVPPTERVEFDLVSVARVACAGRLVEGDEPIAFAEVSLSHAGEERDLRPEGAALPPGLDARTDASGAFRFENVPPGRYRLAARVPRQRWRHVETLRLTSAPKPVVIDVAASALRGVVVDATGARVPRAAIEIERLAGTLPRTAAGPARHVGAYELAAETDEDGAFRLSGLVPGESLRVRARRGANAASKSFDVRVPERERPAVVALQLEPRGVVELAFDPRTTARSAADEREDLPLPDDAFVVLVPNAEAGGALAFVATVPAGGTGGFRAIAPGEWTLFLYSAQGLTSSATARSTRAVGGPPSRMDLAELLDGAQPETVLALKVAADEATHVDLGAR